MVFSYAGAIGSIQTYYLWGVELLCLYWLYRSSGIEDKLSGRRWRHQNTSSHETPYLSLRVVGCRRYASLAEAACTKGFASKVLEYEDSSSVLDVPLLAFLRDALIPVDVSADTTQTASPKATHGNTQIRQDSTNKSCCSLNQSECASHFTVYSAIEGPAQPGSDPRYREFWSLFRQWL